MVVDRIERTQSLDTVGDRLQRLVNAVLRPQRLRDVLHGVWLGHPLHPALVQAPAGAFISAAVLDLVPGQEKAATVLVATGTATALPAAVTGLNDWASLDSEQRRTGLVHALSNTAALALYAGSLVARLRGRHNQGRLLGFAALGLVGTGAYLGGHLSYRQGAGVNQAVPDLMRIPSGWHELGSAGEFPESTPVIRRIGDVPVLVYRRGPKVTVFLERCGHQTGPLGIGERVDVGGEQCIVCPWHGSAFRLVDGTVVHGPAATNQPLLEARLTDGRVEARKP